MDCGYVTNKSNFSKSDGKIKRAFEFLVLYHV